MVQETFSKFTKGLSRSPEQNYVLEEVTPNIAPTLNRKELKSKCNWWKSLKADEESSRNGLLGLFTLAILIFAPFSISLLPLKNKVGETTKYWYELMYSTFSFYLFCVLSLVTSINVALSPFKKSLLKVIIDLLLFSKASEIILLCIMHLLWSDVLGYFEPFPFRHLISTYASLALLSARMWNLMPQQRRLDPIFRRQFTAYMCLTWWIIFVTFQLIVMEYLFNRVSDRIQWEVALTVPITKEINDRILDRLATKATLSDNLVQAKFIWKISMNVSYSFWIAVSLATATKATGYVLLAINFGIDLTLCYRVIKLDNTISTVDCKNTKHQSLKKEVLTELILNEIIEILAPIAFIGTTLIAYYGPNRDNLTIFDCTGKWISERWICLSREMDIRSFLRPVLVMTLIDSGSVVISAVFLWWHCRINIWVEYCRTINNYWIHLAVWGGTFISGVSTIWNIDKKLFV